jgi:hypothetical protein
MTQVTQAALNGATDPQAVAAALTMLPPLLLLPLPLPPPLPPPLLLPLLSMPPLHNLTPSPPSLTEPRDRFCTRHALHVSLAPMSIACS